jgi:hypothetical protein
VSGKFGLDDHEETPPVAENLSAALSTFGAVRPRAPIDLPAVDAAAERHGFVSREAPHYGFSLGWPRPSPARRSGRARAPLWRFAFQSHSTTASLRSLIASRRRIRRPSRSYLTALRPSSRVVGN